MYPAVIRQPYKEPFVPDNFTLGDLNQLNTISYIRIEQNMAFDIKNDCGSGNTYTIMDKHGTQLFGAIETTTSCCRLCCGPSRSATLMILGQSGAPALQLHRYGCRCDWFCCFDAFWCQHRIDVRDGQQAIVGTVKQRSYCCVPEVIVKGMFDETVALIRGPCCPSRCSTELQFDILNANGTKVIGNITKRWVSDNREDVNIDHDVFEHFFPPEFSVQEKALLTGALFLVNFLYFEMS